MLHEEKLAPIVGAILSEQTSDMYFDTRLVFPTPASKIKEYFVDLAIRTSLEDHMWMQN